MASGASVSSSSRSTSDASSSSASSIDAEAATGGGSSEPSMHSLCKRLAKKLSVGLEDCISCAEHRKASEIMASLKARLMDPSTAELDGASKIALTCTGVFISKRIVCGDEPEESIKDLKRTLTLLFVLIVLSNRPRSSFQPREGEDEEDAVMEDTEGMEDGEGMEDREGTADVRSDEEKSLGDWECGCFFDCMKESEAQLAVADDLKTKELTSAHICRSSMLVADQKADVLDFEKISTLASYFFNQSSIAMTLQIFNGASKPVDDFLTLSSMSFLASVSSTNDTKLAAIADIAESESGQSVLRDFILSFTLPRKVVGVRRTCLLTREANNLATKEYPFVLGEAHDAAMRGAEYSFAEDPKVLHKICALLAGVAVILTKNAQSIRRDHAFRGRVSLPFLETKIEKKFEFLPRLHYLSETDEWVVWKLSSKTRMPMVEFRGGGFESCCKACLLFMNTVDS